MRIVPPLVAVLFFVACVSDSPSIVPAGTDAGSASDAGTNTTDTGPAIQDDASSNEVDASDEPPPPPKPGTPVNALSVDINGSSNAGFEGPDGAVVAGDGTLVLVGIHADDLTVHNRGTTTTALSPKSPRPEGFVLALDPTGKKKWAVGISSANAATFRNVALGPNGDVFVLADFGGANGVIHGAGAEVPLTAGSTSGTVCLVKLAASDGHVLWVQNFGTTAGSGSFIGRGLSVVDNRILVLIDAFRPLSWNGSPTATGGSFLGVLNDGAGAPVPVAYTMFGPQAADRGLAASLAPDKSILVGGEFFSATFKVLGTQLTQSGALSDGWVASLKPDLSSPNWVKRLDYSYANNSNFGEVRSIAATNTDVFVGGSFTGQVVVDGNIINAKATDGVVVDFDPVNGNVKGSPLLGGTGVDSIASVQMTRDGRLVAGQYASTDAAIDMFSFPAPTGRGAFFFKRNGGAVPFAFTVAGPDVEATGTVLTQTGDALYALGSFKGLTKIGPAQLTSDGGGSKVSIFIAQLAP